MTYLGFEVLDHVTPGRVDDPAEFRRSMVMLDTRTGKRMVDDPGGAPAVTRPFLWAAQGRTAVNTLKTFLTARKGRAVPVWVPTYQQDLILAQDGQSSEGSITVKDVNYTNLMFPNAARRQLVFMTAAGAITTIKKVTGSTRNQAGGTETLSLDAVLGVNLPAATTIVSFLTLCRLATDEAELAWYSTDYVEALLRFTELPREVTP